MNFFDTYYNTNRMWSQGSYILTRFLKSAFTGPVKPTPGTAHNYYDPCPDKDKGFSESLFLSGKPFDFSRTWPNKPPIDIEIQNLALTKELTGQEDKIVLVGVNPGNLSDSGSQPNFSPMGPPLGRSSPYQIYTGGGARLVKTQLILHRDMFDYTLNVAGSAEAADIANRIRRLQKAWADELRWRQQADAAYNDPRYPAPGDLGGLSLADINDYRDLINQAQKQSQTVTLTIFRNVINWFRALQYPVYTKEGGIIAPRVFMRIGQFLQIEGWPNVTVTYDNIYSDGFPVKVTVDFQVTEAVQRAYDQTDIMTSSLGDNSAGMGTYVEWHN